MENNLIEKKNEMLKEAGNKLEQVWRISRLLRETETSFYSRKTLTDLVASKLGTLSVNYDAYFEECEIELPEAEETDESSIDKLDDLEEDLPFVTPDKEVEA